MRPMGWERTRKRAINFERLVGCASALLVVILITAKVAVIYCLIVGNFWCTDAGALREVQVINREMVKLVDIDRGIFKKTRILAQNEDGNRKIFLLDCNILWSCEAMEGKN